MTTQIKGVLFDKDGTLFGYGETWQTWCDQVLARLAPDDLVLRRSMALACGYDPDRKDFLPGSPVVDASADVTTQIWADLHPHMAFDEIEAVGLEKLASLPTTPVGDLSAIFGQFRAMGLALGVATNDFEYGADLQLGNAGVRQAFDFISGFDSGYGAKPDPGMIHGFCNHLGLQPHQVAMVGDSASDLQTGRNAGAGLCVAVLTGPAGPDDLTALADVVLDSIAALPGYLRAQNHA
jgi:phosphoglycolate phosphatase